MDIKFYGANCFEIIVNKTSFVIDPPKSGMGIKPPKLKDAVAIFTNSLETEVADKDKLEFLVDTPGEYEIRGMAIKGVQTKAMTDVHDGEPNTNTAYSLRANGVSLGVLGHPAFPLADEILETLGTLDVLIVPVGGNGFTTTKEEAVKLVKEIEPKIVIPSHYSQSGVNYEVPQDKVSDFLSEIGIEPKKEKKLKVKSTNLPETTEVVVLE